MVCLTSCKQLRKHPEPQTKAKFKAGCFSASEIKSNCDTELQAYITPLNYNSYDFRSKSLGPQNKSLKNVYLSDVKEVG